MSSYYSDTLYPLQDRVLQAIDELQTPFYLTGGTALSRCYFGHRYSDDLDLFVNKDENFVSSAEKIISGLIEKFEVEVILRSETYYSLKVSQILKVDMVNDVAFREGDLQKKPIFSRVDSVQNILSNKLSALISREEPKDVVDIWVISKNTPIKWSQVFQAVSSKAVGIFPPEVARRLVEFPVELLQIVKWVEDRRPEEKQFKKDMGEICDAMLKLG
jgi:predicted nucleotidyltransferase component of viral defense system